MNKNLISLAVAAALSAPLAVNAAPTLYGQLQGEIADYDRDASASDFTAIDDNARGRLGVKGDEDLGEGLKAIYMFEWGVGTDTGDVDTRDRESFVGLKGGFGQVTLGANKSAYKYYGGVSYDPLNATTLEARGNGGQFGAIGSAGSQFGANGFLQNSISYKNNFGPAEFMFTYQFAEVGSGTPGADDDNYAAGLKFKIGTNAEIVVATAVNDGRSNAANPAADSSNTKIGGQVKFGELTISAQVEDHSDDAALSDADAFLLGAQFGIGKGSIVATIGEVDSDTNSADVDYMALAYVYKFTANTRIWGGYRTTDGDTNNALDVDVLAVGMRVDF